MPPYDNRMQQGMGMSGLGMPQPPGMGQQGMPGGIDPQMFQQYLRIMQSQGQQGGPGMQPPNPGMQSMTPDQGMNQAPMGQYGGQPGMGIPQPPGPSAPPGWMGQIQPKPGPGGFGSFDPNMNDHQGPGGPFGYRGNGMPGGSGPFMPPGMDPNMRVGLPGGSENWSGGQFMGPGQGQMIQKPMLRPPQLGGPGMSPGGPGMQSPPIQAPRMPPMPRMPPGAGVYKNPATGQMMNQTPSFSGQNNPADIKPPQPATGGVMNGPPNDVPGPLSSPADPIRVPLTSTSGTAPQEPGMVSSMDKPRKAQAGAPPFNPQASGRKWQPSQKPQTREQKKADVSTRKFTSAAVR